MQHNGLEPVGITHRAVVSAGVKAWQPNEALEHLAEVQQEGLEVDRIPYKAALSAFDKARRSHEAMKLLAAMEFIGLAPNLRAFNQGCWPDRLTRRWSSLRSCCRGIRFGRDHVQR